MHLALAVLAALVSETPAAEADDAWMAARPLAQIEPVQGPIWPQAQRPQAWIAEPPAPPRIAAAPEPGREDESGEATEAAPLQLAIEGASGTRGEASLQIVAQVRRAGAMLGLGAEGAIGPLAPARQGLIAQAELQLAAAALHGEVRLRPEQSGASRAAAEAGVRVEGRAGSLDLSVRGVAAQAAGSARAARAAQAGEPLHDASAVFDALGASVEGEAALSDAFALGVRLAGTANQLQWSGRRSAQPWDELGAAVLEWPDRWEALATLRATAGGASVALAAGATGPAAPDTLAARASVRVEAEAGPSTLAISVGSAHLWPADQWLGELAFSAAFRFR